MRHRQPDLSSPRLRDEDLRIRSARAARLRRFQASDFYMRDFHPWLQQQKREIEKGSLWHPEQGMSNCEAVALGCAYNGGREKAIKSLEKLFELIKEQGERAVAELNRREAKS